MQNAFEGRAEPKVVLVQSVALAYDLVPRLEKISGLPERGGRRTIAV